MHACIYVISHYSIEYNVSIIISHYSIDLCIMCMYMQNVCREMCVYKEYTDDTETSKDMRLETSIKTCLD